MAMMFTCVQASATALTLEDVQQAFNKLAHYTVNELPKSLRRHLNSGWSRATLDSADAERENVLTTVDADGTKTLYSYDSPIKYVDEEGYVRFIDSSLKPCVKADGLFDWYSYENTANSVKTYFPLFIGTGVLVESEQGNIRMTPKGAGISMSSRVEEGNEEYVLYKDVFDKNTNICYTAINEGVKEDIILEAYNGNNTFEYIVEAEGLTPVRSAGKTVEFYDGNLQTAYTLGEIVLFDSADMPATNSNNSYTVEEIDDGKYLVTLVIDEEFLTDENTVYPVVIDPTVESYGYFNDNGVFATYYKNITLNGTATKDIDTDYACVGSVESVVDGQTTYSNAITYMRFTSLTPFVHINPANISDVTLTLKIYGDTMPANPDLTISAYNFDSAPNYASWDWDKADEYSTHTPTASDDAECWRSHYESYDGKTTVTENTLALNIKDLFKQWLNSKTKYYWKEDTLHHEDGFFITAPKYSESRFKIYSTKTGSAPTISVTYTEDKSLSDGYYYIQAGYYYPKEDYPVNPSRYLTANKNGSITIEDYTGNANQIWHIRCLDRTSAEGQFSGDYSLYNMDKDGYIYTASDETIALTTELDTDVYNTSVCQFKILDQNNGYKRIVKKTTNKTLSVKNYKKENGSIVVHEGVTGLDCQRWNIKPVDKLVIPGEDPTINMVVGEHRRLGYNLVEGAQLVSLTSSKKEVVSLDGTRMTAISEGTSTITAKAKITTSQGDLVRDTTWTVNVGPQTISLSDSHIELNVGDQHDLITTTEPSGLQIVWSSSNEDVATYNPQTGKVSAIGVGETVITVSANDGSLTDSCTVVVKELVVIQKDGDYGEVIFNDGKRWKLNGFYYDPTLESNVPIDEWRSKHNEMTDYTIRQLGFLYKIDPNGVIRYVHYKNIDDDDIKVSLCYKDAVFTEIFGREPQFYQYAGGELHPITLQDWDERKKYYSEAEFLFGTHPRLDASNIIGSIVEFALIKILEKLNIKINDDTIVTDKNGNKYPIFDIVIASYFTGAVEGAINEASIDFISDLTNSEFSNNFSNIFNWATDICGLISSIYETVLPSCVTGAHIAIYTNAVQNNSDYVIKVSDNNETVDLNEFIEHYEGLLT